MEVTGGHFEHGGKALVIDPVLESLQSDYFLPVNNRQTFFGGFLVRIDVVRIVFENHRRGLVRFQFYTAHCQNRVRHCVEVDVGLELVSCCVEGILSNRFFVISLLKLVSEVRAQAYPQRTFVFSDEKEEVGRVDDGFHGVRVYDLLKGRLGHPFGVIDQGLAGSVALVVKHFSVLQSSCRQTVTLITRFP